MINFKAMWNKLRGKLQELEASLRTVEYHGDTLLSDGRPNPDYFDLDKPSDRIEFALQAMRWWDSLPGGVVYMSHYRQTTEGKHLEDYEGISAKYFKDAKGCLACCGGAARCAVEGWTPENFVEENLGQVNGLEMSLNEARIGNIGGMFDIMGLGGQEGAKYDRLIASYCPDSVTDNAEFFHVMYQLVDDLRAGGY